MASSIGDLVATLGMNNMPFVKKVNQSQQVSRKFAAATGSSMRTAAGSMGVTTTASRTLLGSMMPLVGVARSLVSMFLPLSGLAVFAGTIRSGEVFNQKMNQSLAIMGDVSNAMKGEMREAAFRVAKSTKYAASEAAEAYYFLASAGLDAKQSIAALPQVAAFAQAGNFDLALATDLATDAQSALGLTVKDSVKNLENLTRVTDVLIKANTLANASAEQFSTALTNKAGASLRALGKDVEEGVAVLAAFADQGIKGEIAGTQLAIVLRDLQTKAIENKKAFAAAGVGVFDSAGEMRNMADIIADLENLLGGMSDETKKAALMQLGFSDKSISATQALLGTSEKVRQYEKDLRSAGGMTKEVADKQLTPFQKVWAWLSGTATQIGTKVMAGVNAAIGWVGKFSDDFVAIASGISAYWTAAWEGTKAMWAGIFGFFGVTAQGLETTIHTVLQNIAGFFDQLAFVARNMWPLTQVAFYDFVLSYLEAFPQMEGPILALGKIFVGTWAGIKAFFRTIIDNMIGGLKELMNFGKAVGAAIAATWDSVMSGDFAGAASAGMDAFVKELASQKDVVAPNAFTAFQNAYADAGAEFAKNVEKSGGLTNHLKGQRAAAMAQIEANKANRTTLSKTAESAADSAAAKVQEGGTGTPPPPPPSSGEKMTGPKALAQGSAEAWKKIVQATYGGSKKDKIAEATKNAAEETAKHTGEMVRNGFAEVGIGG